MALFPGLEGSTVHSVCISRACRACRRHFFHLVLTFYCPMSVTKENVLLTNFRPKRELEGTAFCLCSPVFLTLYCPLSATTEIVLLKYSTEIHELEVARSVFFLSRFASLAFSLFFSHLSVFLRGCWICASAFPFHRAFPVTPENFLMWSAS